MKACWLLSLSLLLAGCESLAYYHQAVSGHLSLMRAREPIPVLVADERTEPELRQRLQRVLAIRRFAEQALALPAGDSFMDYVALERPFVVWNVFAAPPYSLTPQRWCYPVAGCVSYRGYFSEERAHAKAAALAAAGLDVFVGGVSAYSTLGWFADPLLSTQLRGEEYQWAALIFHELAHQRVYLRGDTTFNESFATVVEIEGLRRWLASQEASDERRSQVLAEARQGVERREAFVSLVQKTTEELGQVYASAMSEARMAEEKVAAFARLRTRYAQLRAQWVREDGGEESYRGGYESWMAGELNNARLLTVSAYFDQVPLFSDLLEEVEHDLPSFYEAVSELAAEQRQH